MIVETYIDENTNLFQQQYIYIFKERIEGNIVSIDKIIQSNQLGKKHISLLYSACMNSTENTYVQVI